MTNADPNRVLFLGDTHGVRRAVRRAVSHAAASGCDTIFQVGDFGLWPPAGLAHAFLAETDFVLDLHEVERLVWIDGNHDWHDRIDELVADPIEISTEGFVRCSTASERVWFCPRGTVWTWHETRFGALGGAVSVDQEHRTVFESWWPQEAPTGKDLARLSANANAKRLDVLITHDAPTIPPGVEPMRLPSDIAADDEAARQLIDQAVEQLAPKQLVHGHWHHPCKYRHRDTTVIGLADGSAPMDRCTFLWPEAGDGLPVTPRAAAPATATSSPMSRPRRGETLGERG